MVNTKTISVIFRSMAVLVCVLPTTIKSACEVGRYGPNCEHKCNCLNNLMCDEGKCDGLCKRGLTGMPNCQQPCPSHKFGLKCHYDCHCANNDDCDDVNGDCPTRECASGYEGAACQRKLPRMLRAPSILHFSCNNVSLGWDRFYDNIDEGEGPVGLYIVRTKAENSPIWMNPINVTEVGKQYYMVTVTSGLVPGTYYTFRIDIQASAHDKLLRVPQPGPPSAPFLNKCSASCEVDRYGPNCEHRCNCMNNQMCVEGKCNGLCKRGFTGMPFCQEPCPSHKFGLQCYYQCHCANNEDCDDVNGDCPTKECASGYYGAGCQRKLPRMLRAPSILHFSCNNVTLAWDPFYDNIDEGVGPVGKYIVKSKAENSQIWMNPINVTDELGKQYYLVTVTSGFAPGSSYMFRIDLQASAHGKLLGVPQPGPPSAPIFNKCSAQSRSGQSKLNLDWVLWIASNIIAFILTPTHHTLAIFRTTHFLFKVPNMSI